MIPVVSFVGYSNSGKTTLLIKVIKALKDMQIRVGTIKHHHGVLDLDVPGTDTWRHYQSGADTVVLATTDRIFINKRISQPSLEEVIKMIDDVDIILIEGFKRESVPKIEILRQGIHSEVISPLEEIIAFATDWKENEGEIYSLDIPKLSINDPEGIAIFIKERYIK